MHLKRQNVPKSWPVYRKGTKYVIRAGFEIKKGLPLLVVIRDLMKVAQNRKEVKKAIHLRQILINNRPATDEKNSVLLFDTITIVPDKKHYRLEILKGGKFSTSEINGKDSGIKTVKIVDKKILKGKKIQLNFSDGKNVNSNTKCSMGDSAIINVAEKKLLKVIPLKEGSKVFVFSGKHSGKKGKVVKIDKNKKTAEVDLEGNPVHVLIKQIMATE